MYNDLIPEPEKPPLSMTDEFEQQIRDENTLIVGCICAALSISIVILWLGMYAYV
jgi:hypothetical protein